ncbi:hypothetical protein NQ317_007623 [Molorchus minor]|uniref:C2H2-type domain-containing protein n=1 Tax=Molorchus minor TaxID=1323400 RepID=A0ABQ9J078_9CUCU|nr:hypothetical protein NQ317_007623 [Molorchus minor]
MDSVTCSSCVGILSNYVNFATICDDTEEKINLYRETGQNEVILKSSNILTFLRDGIRYNNVNIKKENTPDNLEYCFEGPDVKEKVELLYSSDKFQTHTENFKCHLLSHKDNLEVQMFECKMCEYQTKYKRDLKKHLLVHKDISEVQMFKCEMCEFQTKHRGALKKALAVSQG